MKILAIRFYKKNKNIFDIINENLDKELKRKLKLPKKKINTSEKLLEVEKKLDEIDDIHLIVYSIVKETNLKKKPDIAEIGLGGTISEKLELAKNYLNKEIKPEDFFKEKLVVDIRGLTKGHGLSGPVKRFGIGLKEHKSEKGRRRPGSIGAWTPSRVTFRAPMAGQLGFFTRLHYNSNLLAYGPANKLAFEFPSYGKLKSNYILLKGSVQGPSKRQLMITLPLRETKRTLKRNYEILKLMK